MNKVPHRFKSHINKKDVKWGWFRRLAKDIRSDDMIRCCHGRGECSVHIEHPHGKVNPNKTIQSHIEHDVSNPNCVGCDIHPLHKPYHSLEGEVQVPYTINQNNNPVPVDGLGGTFI